MPFTEKQVEELFDTPVETTRGKRSLGYYSRVGMDYFCHKTDDIYPALVKAITEKLNAG